MKKTYRGAIITASLLLALAGFAYPAQRGEVVRFDEALHLQIDEEENFICLTVHREEAETRILLPSGEDHSTLGRMRFGNLDEVVFFDRSRVWLIFHINPRMDCAFLFNFMEQRVEAKLLGLRFRVSPSGAHIAYYAPHAPIQRLASLCTDGFHLFEESELLQGGYEMSGGFEWVSDDEIGFLGRSVEDSGLSASGTSSPSEVLVRIHVSDAGRAALLSGQFPLEGIGAPVLASMPEQTQEISVEPVRESVVSPEASVGGRPY